ncbi:MAG: TolC family outer membrane protein [Alphaproteobacteria bacterium]
MLRLGSVRRLAGGMTALALLALPPLAPATADTLVDALAQTYTTNPRLLAQRAALRASDEQVPQALSGWRPTVTINAQAGYTDATSENRTTQNSVDLQPRAGSVTINQPIFNNGAILATVDQAKNVVQAARAQLFSTEQAVLLDAATAFANVVRDTAVLQLNQNNERVLGEQLRATQDRFEVGELTRTDVAQAEARLASAVANRIQAEGALTTSIANYEQVIGPLPAELVRPRALSGLPASRQDAIAIALANNPDIAAAEFNLRAATDAIDTQIATLLPTLSLQGEYRYAYESSTPNTESRSAAILAILSIPLYQSGAEYSAIRAARQTMSQRQSDLDQAKRLVTEAVTAAWDQLQTARAAITSFQAAVRAQEIALEGTRQESTVGTRTILDVLDAEQELFNAQVSVERSQRDEVIATYTLARAIGGLTAAQLGLPVTYYDVTGHYDDVKDAWIGTE